MKKEKDLEKNKESRLLETAFRLFTEKGMKDTSVQEIVDNADVAKGTFYLYFKDKYEIRDILIARKSHKLFNDALKELRRNYIILESKVQSIVEEKEGKDLPYDSRKITKKEIIELETHKFLNKYEYTILDKVTEEEPKYQDTMTNEIGRIIEYINSSNII